MTTSAFYEGWVRHRRYAPRKHAFRYPLFQVLLDLGEVPAVFDRLRLWSATAPAPLRFRRRDYHGNPDVPLDRAVRDTVERASGQRPEGRIRLLTHLRTFGHVFNPVSFYYCDDRDGRLQAILAEITNTPWGERHAYVLGEPVEAEGLRRRYRLGKSFHVSPFQPMDVDYDWRFTVPGERLVVHMDSHRSAGRLFDATLVLRRRELSDRTLAGLLFRHAGMTVRSVAWIYWQAARLWAKRIPFHPHPDPAARRSWP